MMRQYEMVERVRAYDPNADEDVLNKAYVFAVKAHGSQTRASGDPYFSHPVEVAGILTQMRLDSASVITGLLHDVVEDTDVSLEEIDRIFGPEVARLVDGVTKLSRIELQSDQSKQAENFRKLVLAMSEDIRVLLVKLADRLHNMRTLHFIKNPDKRRRIAHETMDIYAPLAERIGIQEMKDELEDLAFIELNPEARKSILTRLEFLREEGGDLIGEIIQEFKEKFDAVGLKAEINGRAKTPYSIWRKMQRKNVGFEQLSDIMAFRITVDTVEECYQALGHVHSSYPVVPGRFKDYISTPKPNDYRSLHSGVIGPQNKRIELQIRTHEMQRVAELGVAAHWQYKQGSAGAQGKQYRWLRELLDILEHAAGPEEFLEHTKLEMFQDQVFCFTPKGDLIALPRGATPVDFAYAVHSSVGDRCFGAKINGRMMPLRSALQNGDQVEVITSKNGVPSPSWDDFVVTGKAKARIRRFVRAQRRTEFVSLGREMLQKSFRHEGFPFSDRALEGGLKELGLASVEDLYAAIAEGKPTPREVLHVVHPASRQPLPKPSDKIVALKTARKPAEKSQAIPIRGLIPGMAVHYARCCHPLPGDRIVGIVTTGKGVTVHTIDCAMLETVQESPERWIDVAWDTESAHDQARVGRLSVVVENEPGSMGALCTVIGRHEGNIANFKITNRSMDFFDIIVDVEVSDVRHLTNIIAALRATPSISSVDRARG
jgi:GTP pyrophosphokinase